MNINMNKLNVQAIFDSIDGEANAFDGAGQLTTFLRLKGCNLNCSYCDTQYAQSSRPENRMSVDEIIQQIHFKKITITGGEPMLQWKNLGPLLLKLLSSVRMHGCQITIETNGSVEIPPWESGCEFNWVWNYAKGLRYVVDYKLPSSGMEDKMISETFKNLCADDVIKFVIANERDYARACEVVKANPRWSPKIVFSPTINIISTVLHSVPQSSDPKFETEVFKFIDSEWPQKLAERMIKDKVPAQFGLQLHKILWPGAIEER